MKKAIVLLDGKQDSIVALFWAKNIYHEVHALTFSAGLTANQLEAAKQAAQIAVTVSHITLTLPAIPDNMNGSTGIKELVTGSRQDKPRKDFTVTAPLLNLSDKDVLELADCLNGCGSALTMLYENT
jgi:7-cyano-7-deazaguanine synthase in queuosine biosynthesis